MTDCHRVFPSSPALTPDLATAKAQRRDRIVTAATQLAHLGYDSCQMRAVAAIAGVAASTVYLYFPSKDDLLLACLRRWLRAFGDEIHTPEGGSANGYARLLLVFELLTARLSGTPGLADAMIRPYLYAQGPAAEHAQRVRDQIVEIFSAAMADGYPAALRSNIADMVTDVWATNLSSVAQQRTPLTELTTRLAHVLAAVERREDARIRRDATEPHTRPGRPGAASRSLAV